MTQKRRRLTLRDVAEVAGVSEMTVSRVLRGSGVVSARSRAHIISVVEKMGYVQNQLAGSLATTRSNQIAVIIPSLVNNVFTEVMEGITLELEKADYHAIVGISGYSLQKEEALLYSMMSWRPAGIIVPNIYHTQKTRNMLASSGVPVVEMMSLTDTPIDMCVGLDQRAASREIARYLLSRGYKRFGYVGWNEEDYSAADRFEEIRLLIEDAGLEIIAPDLFASPPNFADGKRGLSRLLDIAPDLDAVIFSNDTAATGGMMHCIEAGIRIPHDLAIAGFSGLPTGQNMPQKLTTIVTKRHDIGRVSARSIIRGLEGAPTTAISDLKFELNKGQTA